jgi:AraC-like DNA-binding protein
MPEYIQFHKVRVARIDAMTAHTARGFPRHTHDQYGIGVIDTGGHASYSGRGQVEAGPGSLIFVNPGEVHDGRPIQGQSRSWRMLYFEMDLREELRADVTDGTDSSFTFARPVFSNTLLRRSFNEAFTHAMSTPIADDATHSEAAVVSLVARMAINATAAPRTSRCAAAPTRRARELIDADPSAPLTLAVLAGEVGLSRYQLLRGFARELGLTPHAYILQRRMATARQLIRAGETLAKVAIDAGFYDQSHLTRCFLRQLGVTPGRYAASCG